MVCPDENKILAFVEGRLSSEDLGAFEAHSSECPSCRVLLGAALRADGDETVASSGPAPQGRRAVELERGATVGRYTVLNLAGRGGMSEVYAAYDPELDRKIALKLLYGDSGAARAESRLLREAKAIAKLAHPNVISVYDAGDFHGRVFLAMEFVEGHTLQAWLDARARSVAEILPVFAAAARGLAAAHAGGLVHRDFKPHNVMVGDDGAVRVMDFGLVRQLGEAAEGAGDAVAGDATRGHDVALTQTGELLGTPLYMAPEQFKGVVVDAHADQFSFCVALYRALYGTHPFAGTTLGALMADVLAGRVKTPPARSAVPARLRNALLRGLSVDPAARWPSMGELEAVLTDDPARRRRRALAIGAAALAAVAAVGLAAHGSRRAEALCQGGPARLAGVWEPTEDPAHPGRRDAVKAGFLASRAPAASDVWARVAVTVDAYAKSWLGMYREACEATQLRGEQSETVLDLRMSCLDERRQAIVALGDVLHAADREVVGNAVDAASALPSLDRCANVRRLREVVEPPRDPKTRARVDELRKQLATVNALDGVGKRREGAEKARALVAAARAVRYQPFVAESLEALGRVLGLSGQHGEVELEEAVWVGMGARRLDVAAAAASFLVGIEGYFHAKHEEGERWSRMTFALLEQLGGDDKLTRASTLTSLAAMRNQEGRSADALALIREALTLRQQVLPPNHPDIARCLVTQGEAEALAGHYEASLAAARRALEIFEQAEGATSVWGAQSLNNMGEYLNALARHEEALQAFRRSLTTWEAQVGPDHQFIAYPLTGIGVALEALGRPAAAIKPLERALQIREAREPDPATVAATRFVLARALWGAGVAQGRADALARRALDDTPPGEKRGEIEAALAAHPMGGKTATARRRAR